jgi:hypothetical protein
MGAANSLVTRFPGGVTNASPESIFASMVQPDPTKFHEYFNDFDTYVAADWVVTETQAGATQALTAGDGGWLLITNTAADDDLAALQKTPAAFSFTAGKKAFFACRFKVSDATQSDVAIGLQVVDTTPLDVTDGVYFLKADGAATYDFICRKNATTGSTSASAVGALVADTFTTLAFYYDGDSKAYYAVDGVVKGSVDASSTYLPDTICTPSFALQNGEAVAKTMTVDFIYAAAER